MGIEQRIMIQTPEWTTTAICVTALQAVSVLTSGVAEFKGDSAGYSKFNKPGAALNVSSRLGMCLIYALGLLASIHALQAAATSRTLLVSCMLFVHYAKRELEVGFVHKYSGEINLPASALISIAYGFTAVGTSYYTANSTSTALQSSDVLGAAMFLVGQAGNGWHHWSLAQLRSPGAKKNYVIPSAGLFRSVACPHYLFELIGWYGVAVCSGTLFGVLNALSMTHYLAGRSYNTTRWYKSKFGSQYPSSRKHLIPGLF